MKQIPIEQIKSDSLDQRTGQGTVALTPSLQLKLIHLQLTGKCNLRCPFCGQWGSDGYFCHQSTDSELSTKEWLRVIDEAVALAQSAGIRPEFNIWGGEPLLSPAFETIASHIAAMGCKVALVTNGTLLKQHIEAVNRYIATLYVSIDGPEAVHEQARNAPGIFSTIQSGLKGIDRSRVTPVCLTTVCENNAGIIDQIPFTAARLGFEKIVIQNLIYCSSTMAEGYAAWLDAGYGQTAPQVKSWITDKFGSWVEEAAERLKILSDNIHNNVYPLPVVVHPAELLERSVLDWYDPATILESEPTCCRMPFAHLQITAGGDVNFCVDFCDFSLGNVQEQTLEALWSGSKACQFREDIVHGRNPLCRRCPWFYNKQLKTD